MKQISKWKEKNTILLFLENKKVKTEQYFVNLSNTVKASSSFFYCFALSKNLIASSNVVLVFSVTYHHVTNSSCIYSSLLSVILHIFLNKSAWKAGWPTLFRLSPLHVEASLWKISWNLFLSKHLKKLLTHLAAVIINSFTTSME